MDALPYNGGLAPYVPTAEAPWTPERIRHVLWRATYGFTPAQVQQWQQLSPTAALDGLFEGAQQATLPPLPDWHDTPQPRPSAPDADIKAYKEQNERWRAALLNEVVDETLELRVAGTAFRERMALLWHHHVVATSTHATHRYRYLTVLRTHALGNFRSLIHAVGITPAMLYYLDGVKNAVGAPNENYARELFELFTLGITGPEGQRNYTQRDVSEAGRALTGWAVDLHQTVSSAFVPERHDPGLKTLFGQTGSWGYEDVIRILFEQRAPAIAHFVSTKLYRQLVNATPNPEVVAEMAARLLAHEFELGPVVRALLGSQHLLAQDVMGAQIKGPFALLVGFYRQRLLTTQNRSNLQVALELTGEVPFEPPNVAGWPGDRAWIDTGTLKDRWLYLDSIASPRRDDLIELARTFSAPNDPYALTNELAAYFFATPLPANTLGEAVEVLLNGIPPYEWSIEDTAAKHHLYHLVSHLIRLPEFQLA